MATEKQAAYQVSSICQCIQQSHSQI